MGETVVSGIVPELHDMLFLPLKVLMQGTRCGYV
jgi:hypothetical protein